MAMTDPLADLFLRILNAGERGHEKVKIPASKLKGKLLEVLKSEGFIRNFEQRTDHGHHIWEVDLRYHPGRQKQSFITGIKRVSKPGCRVYAGKNEIPKVMGGLGVAILTTSNGILTDQESRTRGVGGEVLCYVW